ncbi:substrate-binding domain-containing protein, partial [Armatimonas sp.]|uniref:substrate-binding domain-containing protein n=1 Tax=Armatimonas sp. TaxID=1872638 RepID=UPI00286CDCC2
GIRVPEDVSLTGYDALPEGELVRPRLTTVDQALDWQLRTALDLLCHPTFPTVVHSHIAVPTLVRGGSVAPPLS